jgi:hypothetical protein
MYYFPVFQFIKDSIAVLLFALCANMPKLLNTNTILCLMFGLGCLIDAFFVFFRYYYKLSLTIASTKDIAGMFGMFIFSSILAYQVEFIDVLFWKYFFYLAFAIDYISVLSVCSYGGNIYKCKITSIPNHCTVQQLICSRCTTIVVGDVRDANT